MKLFSRIKAVILLVTGYKFWEGLIVIWIIFNYGNMYNNFWEGIIWIRMIVHYGKIYFLFLKWMTIEKSTQFSAENNEINSCYRYSINSIFLFLTSLWNIGDFIAGIILRIYFHTFLFCFLQGESLMVI